MDDLDILREAWDRPAPPDPATRQAARDALLAAVTPETQQPQQPRRRSRTPKLLAAGLAAAAAVAVGVVALQDSGGKTSPHPGSTPQRPVGLMAAQRVLGAAATAAGKRPYTAPRPDQWIYFRTSLSSPEKPKPHQTQGPGAPLHTRIDENWQNPEATRLALYERGRLQIGGYGSPTGWPPTGYTRLMSLPRDPAKLLAMFRAAKAGMPVKSTPDSFAFETFSSMLLDSLVPPEVERAVYQAIALIPGVTVVHNTVDLAGRPAIAVNYRADGWRDDQLLLDPKTYAYLGERQVAGATYTEPGAGWTVAKGQVMVLITQQTPVVVDKPGQKPPTR